jgi:site-specific recombinase XerD
VKLRLSRSITTPQYINSSSSIATVELSRWIKSYRDDARMRQLSPRASQERNIYWSKLVWYLNRHDFPMCDTEQVRGFFTYLTVSHEDPKGVGTILASGNRYAQSRSAATSPEQSLFNWLVQEGVLESSPMARLRPPKPTASRLTRIRMNI